MTLVQFSQRSDPAPTLHAIGAEQAIIGSLMIDGQHAFGKIAGFLNARHFSEPVYSRAYAVICERLDKGGAVDPVLVAQEMPGDGALEELGGVLHLSELVNHAPPAANLPDYAKAVFEAAVRRDVMTACTEGMREVAAATDGFAVVSALRQRLEAIESAAAPDDAQMVSATDVASRAIDGMRQMAATGRPRGLMTGLRCIDRRLNGLKPGALVVIGGRPGMGKAQPLDAKVLRADGTFARMGDLRVGDALASVDGQPSKVAGVFPQGEEQVYRLTFSDGRSTEASGEHLWRVRSRHWPAARVLTTIELRELLKAVRHQRRLWIDQVDGRFGSTDALPLDPWALGALLGDGNLKRSIRFSSADAEMVEELRRSLGALFSVRKEVSAYDYRVVMATPQRRPGVAGGGQNLLKETLSELGVMGLGAENKYIPAAYMSASREARVALLQGLMDTDGWAEGFNAARFCSVSEALAQGIVDLVRSLGGSATIRAKRSRYTYLGEHQDGRTAYVVNVSGLSPEDVFRLPRKLAQLRPRTGQKRLTLHSVEPTRITQTQCIAVTHPTRLYVTDDYVVTHNTGLARAIAHGAAVRAPQMLFPFLNLEMDSAEIMSRELASITHEMGNGVEYRTMDSGSLTPLDFTFIDEARQKVPANLIFDERCASLSVDDVRRKVWSLSRRGRVGAVFIDYLQLMRRPQSDGRNEASVIAEMTRSLKQLARDAKTCVVLLSQLNRGVEQRDDKRPLLSDLRESGSIEQDADAVLFPFREHYYLAKAEPTDASRRDDWQMRCAAAYRRLDVHCAKQRGGPEGTDRQLYFAEFDYIEDSPE